MPFLPVEYVNIYLVDRAYGGSEEGGWWFDYGTVQASIPVLAYETGDEVKARYQPMVDGLNRGRRDDISSMASEGQYRIFVQCQPAADFPERQPRYE